MAEKNRAEFTIAFEGDEGGLGALFSKLKSQVKSEVAQIEKATNDIQLFRTTEKRIQEAGAAFQAATVKADELRAAVAKLEGSGQNVGKELTKSLKDANRESAAAQREFEKQAATLNKLNASLTAVGVNTKSLALEEIRLATAAKQAAAAEEQRQARLLLGIKSTKEIAAENAKLVAAYNTLRASGTATYADLQRAAAGLREKQAELEGSTGGIGARFMSLRASALGYAAALGVVVAALKTATDASREYEKQLSRVGTVSDLTDEQLRELGAGVRELSTTLGFDLKEGLDAVYALLRQGVPAGNVLEVLATADDAAKAAVTDLGTAAKLSGTLIQAFGISADNLKPTLDALFAAMRNGGATFDELAAGLGGLAPLAKATKTPVEEIAAAIQVMVRAGLEGPEAIGELTRILTRLADPKVRKNLADMGIETRGLVDTLRAIGERGLALDELIGLELSSKKAAAGIAALTADSTRLAEAMRVVGESSGTIDQVADSVGKIRAEAVAQLVASLDDLLITLGELSEPSAETIRDLATLVRGMADLSKAARDAQGNTSTLGNRVARSTEAVLANADSVSLLTKVISLLGRTTASANKDLAATAEQAKKTQEAVGDAEQAVAAANAAATQAARQRLAELRGELKAAIPELQAAAKMLQGLAAEAIASINTEAATRIAGLDKLTASERDNAAQLVAIQQEAAAQRLDVLTKAGAEALRITEAEATARRAAAGKSAKEQVRAETDIANAKKAVLQTIVQSYQQHVDQLTALETGHLNKVRDLQQQRVTITQTVEDTIRGIRLSGLTEYERFNATLQEIDKLTSQARQALARGDFEAADAYAKKSIDLAAGIAKQVESDGRVIVSQLSAQEIAIGRIKAAEKVLLESIDERATAEQRAAQTTRENLNAAITQLSEFKGILDEVNRTIAAGVEFEVNVNTDSIKAAQAAIDNLKLPTESTHTVRIERVEANAAGGMVGFASRAARVRRVPRAPLVEAVRGFARGGPVFRRPGWTKVPGSGNGDTVPALLQAGSFVVRKASSAYYGDGLMRAIARFAKGGRVKEESPYFGDVRSGTPQAQRDVGEIGPPELPEDPDELRRLILQYAADVASAARLDDGRYWANSLSFLQRDITRYEQRPTEKALMAILRRSRGIGLNLGITRGEKTGFDVDGRKWHKSGFARGPDGLAGLGYLWEFYNRGGAARSRASTDTVPAMLTPGEFVIRRQAVDRIGAGLLEQINSMRIPRARLAAMLGGFAPPQPVKGYATGGAVGNASNMASSTTSTPNGSGPDAGVQVTLNMNASARDLYSYENVTKYLVPQLTRFWKNSRP